MGSLLLPDVFFFCPEGVALDCIRTSGVLPLPLHLPLFLSLRLVRTFLLSPPLTLSLVMWERSLSTDSGSSDVPSLGFLAWTVLPARPSCRLETPAFHPTPPSCSFQGCCQFPQASGRRSVQVA